MKVPKFWFWNVEIVLLFLMGVATSVAQEPTTEGGKRIFKRVAPAVYQIKTAISDVSSKASYGSGFGISKIPGGIVTNYHVVSTAIQEKGKYQVYVVLGGKSVHAEILAVDVIHDLAVLKVDQKLDATLKFASEKPRTGEKIYSIGIPEDLNLSITEGNYNGEIHYGPYENIHMSSPINSGMSGGPTVNHRGELVGVNVAILLGSQSISFSVPLRFVIQLIEQAAKTDRPEVQSTILTQMTKTQEELSVDFLKAHHRTEVFDGWRVAKPSSVLKCWTTNKDDDRRVYLGIQHNCYLNHAAYIRDEVYSGSYEILYRTIRSDRLNVSRFFHLVGDLYNETQEFVSAYIWRPGRREYLTQHDCFENRFKNSAGLETKINVCLRGMVDYPDLYHADIKWIVFPNTEKGFRTVLLAESRLQGFTLPNIRKFIDSQLEKVAPAEGVIK